MKVRIYLISANDINYDESVSFIHTYDYLKKFEDKVQGKNEFPLLINHEFILNNGSGNSSIEGDNNLTDLNNKEMVHTVIARVKQFATTNDNTFKQLFLDNIKTYTQKLGLENTVDLLVPVLHTIVYYMLIISLMNLFL